MTCPPIPQMTGLFHYCNRVLDLADQLRRKNYAAALEVHELYWRMSADERQDFVVQLLLHPEHPVQPIGEQLHQT